MEPGRQGFTHGGPRRLRSAGRRPLQARGPTAAEGASSRLQALPPELERGGRLLLSRQMARAAPYGFTLEVDYLDYAIP